MDNHTLYLLPYDNRGDIPFNVSVDRIYRLDRAVYLERVEEHETIFLGEYDTEDDADDMVFLISLATPDMTAIKIANPGSTSDIEILRGMMSTVRDIRKTEENEETE